jgi:hypothetical protein
VVKRKGKMQAEDKGSEGRGEVIYGMVEVLTKFKGKERVREEVYVLVKMGIKGSMNVSERGGKIIYWLVKLVSKGEVGERDREVVNLQGKGKGERKYSKNKNNYLGGL